MTSALNEWIYKEIHQLDEEKKSLYEKVCLKCDNQDNVALFLKHLSKMQHLLLSMIKK